jgi:FKBP-type peptidyl-prolyl cis-trans isomerase FklB
MFSRLPLALATLLASLTLPLYAQDPVLIQPKTTEDQTDNASYLIGFNVGTDLLQNGFNEKDFIGAQVLKGMMDALMGKKPALSNADIEATGLAINAKLQAREAESTKKLTLAGQANLEKSKAFMAENQKKDGVQTLKSGLQYIVLKKGQGKSPSLTSVVKVNYEGKLITGEVFDASAKHGGPAEFPVGKVIAGWTEALQRMAVGDKWQLFIPPELAYGLQAPPSIGPNQALIFEVELLEIVK